MSDCVVKAEIIDIEIIIEEKRQSYGNKTV